MSFTGYGLITDVPSGWLSRMFDHANDEPGSFDNDTRPAVHTSTFGMPTDTADFGSAVIASMTSGDAFMTLVEYTPDCLLPDEALRPDLLLTEPDPTVLLTPDLGGFPPGFPTLDAADFGPDGMHGDFSLTNPVAAQYFFSLAGRPFCLYVVIGDAANLTSDLDTVRAWLAQLVVSPAAHAQFTLNVDFGGVLFNSLIIIWGPPPPKVGPISGTGQGVCTFFRGDTGTVESSNPASFTLTGGQYVVDRCQDAVVFNGDLTAVLNTGRTIPFGPVTFTLPMGGLENPTMCYATSQSGTTPGVCKREAGHDGCYDLRQAQVSGALSTTFGGPPGTFNFLATYVLFTPDDVTMTIPAEWSGPGAASASVDLLYPARAPAASSAGLRQKPRRQRRVRVGRTSRVALHEGAGNRVKVRLTAEGRALLRRKKHFDVDAVLAIRRRDGTVQHARHRLTLTRPGNHRRRPHR